ncbi:MAG TPA: hypothetical protein VK208_05900 [Pyrinomonadaceae bacterium]|jgi:hypothetical protein|nr:hypothetical protein [Pyrinomonadaceae bacterium]
MTRELRLDVGENGSAFASGNGEWQTHVCELSAPYVREPSASSWRSA